MPDSLKIHDLDTSRLRFDPNDPHFYEKICKDIKEFGEYSKTNDRADQTNHRLYAWIVLMYDMNTPLRREIKDMYKRKVYAGTLVGLTPHKTSGKYREYVEKIFTGVDLGVNALIVAYIASFASPEYMQLMGHVTMQQNALDKIISGTAKKDDQIMFDASTKIIKELTNLLYGGGERDEVYEARRALYKQVSYDLSDMRPEKISKLVVEGGLPDEYNPYEGGYVPNDIKFVGDDPAIAIDDEE